MSYCRWGSDDYQCDVYAYESGRGIQIHVGKGRYVFKEPLPPRVDLSDTKAYLARHQKVMEMCKESDTVPIGGPHDGESHIFEDWEDAIAYMEMLRAAGYRFPDSALDAMRDELEWKEEL